MELTSIRRPGLSRLLGFAWVIILGAALVASAITTERRVRQVEEYPCCCDPFGYLQMARDIRLAAATGTDPQFTIETTHSRLLIQLMKSRGVPLPLWEDLVAPLAYHYFPETDRVGVQYPPGAGMMLSLFPQDKALHGLGWLVTIVFVMSGLVMLCLAAVKRLWLSAGFLAFSIITGLEILATIDNASFSVNAMLVPLLLTGLCLFAAFALRGKSGRLYYLAALLVFLAGLMFGLAILIRLPVLFLLPGLLVLLWPSWNIRRLYKSAPIAFMLGVFLAGVLPLAMHQSRVSGKWYLPTYPRYDSTPPSLEYVLPNLSFYFGPGKSRPYQLVLPVIIAGCLGLYFWSRKPAAAKDPTEFLPALSWPRVLVSAVLLWGLSMVYFLTHMITAHYYPITAVLGTVMLLSLGAFALEAQQDSHSLTKAAPGRLLRYAALILALVPGLFAIQQAWSNYVPPTRTRIAPRFVLPAELAQENAWIWSSELSGTIWYYTGKAAHKISSTNRETRELVYEFVKGREEPQYIIDDPGMKPIEEEIVQLGGKLELRGEVDAYSYYLIHWPPEGASQPTAE